MRSFVLALLLALTPGVALAHPHVMIDAHAVVEFKEGRIVSLFMGWKLDPVYSSTIFKDFDKNKDGKLDAADMATIETEAFSDTKPTSYLTYPKVNGIPASGLSAVDFKVLGVKGALIYVFRLPLPEPVDPRKAAFSFSTYEETYYIDIDFPEDKAIVLQGSGSDGCKAVMAPDHANPLLGGVVLPKKVEILCP
jgi:tRNA threonylcarbamoyladenosine biosynthesis protein TsaE